MTDLTQAIADTRQAIQPNPDAPAVVILHPNTAARIQTGSAGLASLAGVRVETDPEMDPAILCIVPHSQLALYERARRWVSPWRAVNAAARIEEHQQQTPPPAYQHAWAAEPAEPVQPRAAQQPRRRFPIPR